MPLRVPVGSSGRRLAGGQNRPPVHLSTCPPVHLSTCPPVHLSTCPPVHLSTCPPVHLSSTSQQPANPTLLAPECVPWGCAPIRTPQLEARKNWVHNLGQALTSLTPILSTAHAPPRGPTSGAHAHGTRSGVSREVSVRGSSPVGGRHDAPEASQKGSEQNFVRALRAPNRGSS